MSYAEITFRDRNPVKRWLQRQRLISALTLCSRSLPAPEVVCDFGAGNGELCKLLAGRYGAARIICYEPAPAFLSEARENLAAFPQVEFCPDIRSVAPGTVDGVFCLEVFEHLPPDETADALQSLHDLLKPGGIVVVGVPVEVGLPALYKGLFRMARRYGAFDANAKNVFGSFLMHPPENRPIAEIAPGLRFHHDHMGFDFRRFRDTLASRFRLRQVSAAPFAGPGSWLMPEVNFVAQKRGPTRAARSPGTAGASGCPVRPA